MASVVKSATPFRQICSRLLGHQLPTWRSISTLPNKSKSRPEIQYRRFDELDYNEFAPFNPAEENLHLLIRARTTDAADALGTIFQDPLQDSAQLIRVCLDAEFQRLQRYARRQRAAMFERRHESGKVLVKPLLDTLWKKDEALWRRLLLRDRSFPLYISYFAIAEQTDGLLLDWLKTDVQTNYTSDDSAEQFLLRGSLVRGLVSAHAMHDYEGKLDSAFRCFFDLIKLRKEVAPSLDQRKFVGFSLQLSIVHLIKQIATGRFPGTNRNLYERFVRVCKTTESQKASRGGNFSLGLLRMFHPTDPCPDAMLTFLHYHFDGDVLINEAWLDREVTSDQKATEKILLELRAILHNKQRLQDVDWLDRVVPTILKVKSHARGGLSEAQGRKGS